MGKVSSSAAKISKPGARWHPYRSLHHGNRVAMARHNARVGAVIHAYNSAHAAVLMLLMNAAYHDSHQAARELWFSYGSDKGQRDFAALYCRDNIAIKPAVRRAIAWAIKSLNELAQHRNDAAHSDMIWWYDRLAPGLITKDTTRKRLDEEPFDDLWRPLRGDLSALSNYLMDLANDVLAQNARPSCYKPRLQLLRSEDTKRQERNRQAKQKARAAQRSPSRE